MLNAQGNIAECTGDNLFVVRGGRITTPPVSDGALIGITRGVVFELGAKLNVPVTEAHLTRYDVMTADECFITGSAAEIVPVATVDCRPIGTGTPGPVTLQLMEQFHNLTRSEGTPIKK
jgi:branched-chain amino acid aminotransferase